MIVGKISLLVPTASFVVYDGVTQIENVLCPINSIAETILGLSKKHGIYKVRLSGSNAYIQKFIEEIADKEFLKYGYNKLDIQTI